MTPRKQQKRILFYNLWILFETCCFLGVILVPLLFEKKTRYNRTSKYIQDSDVSILIITIPSFDITIHYISLGWLYDCFRTSRSIQPERNCRAHDTQMLPHSPLADTLHRRFKMCGTACSILITIL